MLTLALLPSAPLPEVRMVDATGLRKARVNGSFVSNQLSSQDTVN